jgi:hypothetical protein
MPSLADEIARTAAQYEALKEQDRERERRERIGTIAPYDPSATEAIAESWRLWRNDMIPDAGLETMLPTEPIREYMASGKGGLLGRAAAAMMPRNRGELMVEGAMSALPALQTGRSMMRSAGLLPRTILGETASSMPKSLIPRPGTASPDAIGRISMKPRYRMTAAERARMPKYESSAGSDLLEDLVAPHGAGSKPYGQSFWTDFRRGVTGSIPGVAREAASYLARTFLGEEE